jgi:hypothetical protein
MCGRSAPADGSAECDFRFPAEEKLAVDLAVVARLVQRDTEIFGATEAPARTAIPTLSEALRLLRRCCFHGNRHSRATVVHLVQTDSTATGGTGARLLTGAAASGACWSVAARPSASSSATIGRLSRSS